MSQDPQIKLSSDPADSPPKPEIEESTGDFGDLFEDDAQTIAAKRRVGLSWLAGSGLLLLVTLGGWFGYNRFFQSSDQSISVVTAPAQMGDIEITITASGTVELGGQQTFIAPADVTVETVAVTERQRVSAGSVLLSLRDRRLQQELTSARVQLQIAQNNLQRQRDRIQESQAKLDRAQNRLAESRTLFDQGFLSEEELLNDQDAAETAQAALKDAQVEQTNSELELGNQRLTIENLQTQLADNQILAPFDAAVLKIEVKAGDGVQQGGRLLTIGDPEQEIIRLQLSTLNASEVEVNLPARISVIGPNAETFEGFVSQISPQAIGSSGDSSGDQATVEAEVRLNVPSDALIPGSAVSVDIIVNQRREVVTVPLTAIQQDAEQTYVWIKADDSTAEKRPVEVGLQGVEAAEITTGLAVDDQVVVFLPDVPLTPGMPLGNAAEAFPEELL